MAADPLGTTEGPPIPADELPDPGEWCCIDCNGDPADPHGRESLED